MGQLVFLKNQLNHFRSRQLERGACLGTYPIWDAPTDLHYQADHQASPPPGAASGTRSYCERLYMTHRIEECELKALECECIASSLAAEYDPLRRIYQDLATKWREKARHVYADQQRRDGCPA